MSDGERTILYFLAAYAFTGVALFSGMFFGHKGKVKTHLALIALFLAGFAVTIYFADLTGRFYTFDATKQAIHMPFAYSATAATLLPLVTGWRKWRGGGSLFAHRVSIVLFLAVFVGATATGVLMLLTRTAR